MLTSEAAGHELSLTSIDRLQATSYFFAKLEAACPQRITLSHRICLTQAKFQAAKHTVCLAEVLSTSNKFA